MNRPRGKAANRDSSCILAIVLAVVALAAGLAIVAMSLGWIPANVHAPAWVVAAIGAVFLVGGGLVLFDAFGPRPRFRKLLTALFLAALALPLNWLAFGPDRPGYPTTASIKGEERTVHTGDPVAWIVLVASALIVDAALVVHVLRMARRRPIASSPLDAPTIPRVRCASRPRRT